MSTSDAPDFVVSIYNPAYFASDSGTGLTTSQASALFLSKSSPDTATALTTFTGGIATNDIDTTTLASNLEIGSASNTGTIGIDTAGNIAIAASQTTGTFTIGGGTTRTGAITIGSAGTTNVLPITIGSTAPTSTVTVRNPLMSMSYTTVPTYGASQIGYQYYQSQTLSTLVAATLGADTQLFSQNITAVGKYLVTYGTRITATSTTAGANVTYFSTWIAQSGGLPTNNPSETGVFSLGIDSTRTVGNSLTGIPECIGSNGSAVVTITASTNIIVRYRIAASAAISFYNTVAGIPSNYMMITRIA